ncbi:TonB-dependent receptor [Spirosoma utsteinense]|uniref:TonB-dependent receptor n=1 Tax=Spirosoma utsteinense TaxID=2585773 RepID=UPI00164727F4|nr:TonB-dependent receptor [Spirosoma utsteinense]MBC3787833.1 outer membrane receptor protein involved in Fe transport [Spirosoma utsteinense]
MRQLSLILLFICLASAMVLAQTSRSLDEGAGSGQSVTNLAGYVRDENGQPLAGVTIVVRGTNKGTITKADGRFSLSTAEPLPLTISASFIGYRRQDIVARGNNFRNLDMKLIEEAVMADEVVVSASRVPEDIQKAAVTVERLGARQFANSPAASPFDALQNVKGVDLLTQSLTFKSVNLRGFGANNNNRFLQLTDGMDNRSPGLGFGFGNVAGISDLDVESIELIPGASSALYGPDALQGLMLTTSKSPFSYQGLSAQVKVGMNNVGKENFGLKGYSDLAIRYAKQLGTRFAIKASFQRLSGTDFIADDYTDRSTRARAGFFSTDPSRGGIATGIGYVPVSNKNANFEYDGVNIYGDDINAGGAFKYPADYENSLLQNRLVTRTGYTELEVLGNNGKVFNNRANVSLHYKVGRNMEASVGWYYGNGNFIRTAGFREYFPDYKRNQFKAELKGDNFFVRAYTTQQNAEGWNIGQAATAINNAWKPLNQWATEFGQAYVENKVSIDAARTTADRGRFLPGSASFNRVRDLFANTYNTDSVPGYKAKGLRFRDNSALWHYEGMYNLTKLINKVAEVLVGGSIRHYALNTGGTAVTLQSTGSEYTINEYGAYAQVGKVLKLGSVVTVKPSVAIRYDKNQYFQGGFTPRASAVVSVGAHNFRGSWQSAFRNPSPGQLFAVPGTQGGEVGGSRLAAESARLFTNPAYLDSDVRDFTAGRISESQLRSRAYDPTTFTTEKIKTWEVGYKALVSNTFFVDAFYFHSRYNDFIAAQSFYQPTNGRIADFSTNAYRTLQINFNNFNEIFVDGYGLGAEYGLGRGFTVSGNYAHQVGTVTLRDAQGNIRNDLSGAPVIKRKMSNPEVSQLGRNFFISPENRYNISLNNPRITDRIGATLTYRWTSEMWVEQGTTAGDVWLPSWTSVDAQVSYKVPSFKSVVKLGGTNIFNKYYTQGYGLASIGGLYYVSITFDELMR